MLPEQKTTTPHKNWLLVLLVVEIVYVLAEFAFNAALLNAAGGLVSDNDVLDQIETVGRLLSGVGLGILLYGLVIRRWLSEETLGKGLFALGASLAASIPTMYFGQEYLVEKYLIDGTNGFQREYAESLLLMKKGLHNGVLQIKNVPLSQGESAAPSDLAFMSVMGAVMMGIPDYAKVLQANEQNIARRLNHVSSREILDEIYPEYSQAGIELKESYADYNQASQEFAVEFRRSTPKINLLWQKIDRDTRQQWSRYQQFRRQNASMSPITFFTTFNYTPYIKSLSEYRGDSFTIKRLNTQLLNRHGLELTSGWNGTREHFFEKIRKEGVKSWQQQMNSRGLNGLPPGLSLQDFMKSSAIQASLRNKMGEHYLPSLRPGLSREQLLAQVVIPDNQKKIEQWIKDAKNRQTDLADGGQREEEGRTFVRALIVPPIALILSLFFSLLTLAKLPLRTLGLIDHHRGGIPVPRMIGMTILGAMVAAILAGPMLRQDTIVMKSEIYEMMEKKVTDIMPLGDQCIAWLIKGEPLIYSAGQAILEATGLDQRDKKYKEAT